MSKENKTFSVIFLTKKDKERNGKLPVYMRITVDGCRTDLSMKQWVKQEQWSFIKGMAKGNKAEANELNIFLERARGKILNDYNELLLIDIPHIGDPTISGDVDRNGINEWYFYKVSDIKNFLDSKTDGTYKKIGSMSEIAGKKGIICYGDCNWSEATDHVDVWDGSDIYIRNKIFF